MAKSPCPPQLLVGITIVATEQAVFTTSSDVNYTVDKPELLTVNKNGTKFTLTPTGTPGVVILKLGTNSYTISIVAGSTSSIKIGVK